MPTRSLLILLTFVGCFWSAESSIFVDPRNASVSVGESIVLRCRYPADIDVYWIWRIGEVNPTPIAYEKINACRLKTKTIDGNHSIHREADDVCVLEVINLTQNISYSCLKRGSPDRYDKDKAVIVVIAKESKAPLSASTIIYIMVAIIIILIAIIVLIAIMCIRRSKRQTEKANSAGTPTEMESFVANGTAVPIDVQITSEHSPDILARCCCSRRSIRNGSQKTRASYKEKDEHDAVLPAKRSNNNVKFVSLPRCKIEHAQNIENDDGCSHKVKPNRSDKNLKISTGKKYPSAANAQDDSERRHLSEEEKKEKQVLTSNFLNFESKSLFIPLGKLITVLQEVGADAVAHIVAKGNYKFCALSDYIRRLSEDAEDNIESFTAIAREPDSEKLNKHQDKRIIHSKEFYTGLLKKLKYEYMDSKRKLYAEVSPNEHKYEIREIVIELESELSKDTLTVISLLESEAWKVIHEEQTFECRCHNNRFNLKKCYLFEELLCDHWLAWHTLFQSFTDKFSNNDEEYFEERDTEMKRIKQKFADIDEISCKKCSSIPNAKMRGSIDLRATAHGAGPIIRPRNFEFDLQPNRASNSAAAYNDVNSKLGANMEAAKTGKIFDDSKDGQSDEFSDETDGKMESEQSPRASVDVVDGDYCYIDTHNDSMTKSESVCNSVEEYKSIQETSESSHPRSSIDATNDSGLVTSPSSLDISPLSSYTGGEISSNALGGIAEVHQNASRDGKPLVSNGDLCATSYSGPYLLALKESEADAENESNSGAAKEKCE